MRDIHAAGPAKRILGTFSGASLETADADGLVTSRAMAVTAQTLTGAAFNGALSSNGGLGGSAPRNVTFTTAASVGDYTPGSTAVVTGKHWLSRQDISETLTLTQANGNETLTGAVMFSPEPLTVVVGAQPNTDGSFTIGCGTAKALPRQCDWVRCTVAGNLVCLLTEDNENPRPDGGALAPVTLAVQADSDLPYCVASIHAGTTATFIALSAGKVS